MVLAVFGVTYVLPFLTALTERDGLALDFVIAAAISSGTGLAITAATRSWRRELKPRDGFLLVTVGWIVMSASATIPLLLVLPDLPFTDAFF